MRAAEVGSNRLSVPGKYSGQPVSYRQANNRHRSGNGKKMASHVLLYIGAFAHLRLYGTSQRLYVIMEGPALFGGAFLEYFAWNRGLRHTCDLASF